MGLDTSHSLLRTCIFLKLECVAGCMGRCFIGCIFVYIQPADVFVSLFLSLSLLFTYFHAFSWPPKCPSSLLHAVCSARWERKTRAFKCCEEWAGSLGLLGSRRMVWSSLSIHLPTAMCIHPLADLALVPEVRGSPAGTGKKGAPLKEGWIPS